MLSILIPTFNYNIVDLVYGLYSQALEQQIVFELIVMEDGSTKYVDENSVIAQIKGCKHIVLSKNIGRSAIRNKIADEAKYNHLLFLDCDAQIFSVNYIEKYLRFCKEDCIVIGGTTYAVTAQQSPNFSLRLKYGFKREARTAPERNKSNFSTFNFLISKNIFNQVRFDESINGYGYEDMVFGHRLSILGYKFIQIENPLIHSGLDDNATFLFKTEHGCGNLLKLYKMDKYPFLKTDSKLLRLYFWVEEYKLIGVFSLLYIIWSRMLKMQLHSKNPSLFLYDIYKLLYMCKLSTSE